MTINRSINTAKGASKLVVREKAPNVDTASTATQTSINQEIIQNTAVRGRSYESVISLAPGAADVAPRGVAGGDVGVSFSGSTGNENNYLIDGINTTDPNLGLVGTRLNQYFIKEVNVYTGGYQPEFGRATGGVVQVVTKTGSNEFHGGIFGSWQPFTLTPNTVARLGEALATRTKTLNQYDFGFELGGPIVKDHVWFYIGFAPTFTTTGQERVFRRQTFDPMGNPALRYAKRLTGYECPSYLSDDILCNGPRQLALQTDEFATQNYQTVDRLYNGIAKLQFNINPDHTITLQWIGSPNTFDGNSGVGREVETGRYSQVQQVHDVMGRYLGKFLDRKLQLDLTYGFHYQGLDVRPVYADTPATVYRSTASNPYSLYDFENIPDCRRVMSATAAGAMTNFNPCPITSYTRNGFGQFTNEVLTRHVVMASATYFWRALGSHAIKLGFDFEYNSNENTRQYSGTDLASSDPKDPNNGGKGHVVYRTNASGTSLQIYREYFTRAANGDYQLLNSFTGSTSIRNWSWYLRDSWATSFAPGLLLNYGLRWEIQEGFAADGTRPIFLWDNIAPRVGVTYDWTRKGRSKAYFNYGRFYQSVPLDITDRQFTGEGLANTGTTTNCPRQAINSGSDRTVPVPQSVPGAPCTFPSYVYNGGQYGQVAPGLKGQYINEIVVGYQHDVGLDIVLGVSYTYRNLGNIIEDMSTDGGNFYIVDNPGRSFNQSTADQLKADADALAQKAKDAAAAADKDPANKDLAFQAQVAQQNADNALGRLNAYKSVPGTFPKAERNYHAVMFTAEKRLSNRFSLLGSYTYSRVFGNYPGTFSSSNGQLDPNISSQFDLVDLLANRNGPLPTDRPHNFKLTGFYTQPIGQKGNLIASLTFTAYSGRPILVLGFHPYYGSREVFILPPGAGGRTPTITQFDMHVGYEHLLSKQVRLSVYADLVNMFNQRGVTNVDDEYTASVVAPILNGQSKDLLKLRTADGSLPVLNPNYGNATSFQTPLFMRFGARLSF
mgnify:CR=1 FL=1